MKRTPSTSARARSPAPAIAVDVAGDCARPGVRARRGQQHRCLIGPRLRSDLPLRGAPMTMVHLRRLAEDLIILCGDEHRFLRVLRRAEHRQQHDAAEEEPRSARAGARQDGTRDRPSVALLTTMKGLPSGYNKDLQEDKHAVFDAEDTLAGCAAVVKSVVDGLSLNRERQPLRHQDCSWPPMLPITLWAGACRSGAHTKSSAPWSVNSWWNASSVRSVSRSGGPPATARRACRRPGHAGRFGCRKTDAAVHRSFGGGAGD